MSKGEDPPQMLRDSMDKRDVHTAAIWSSLPRRGSYYHDRPNHVQDIKGDGRDIDEYRCDNVNAIEGSIPQSNSGRVHRQHSGSDHPQRHFLDKNDGDFPPSSPPSESSRSMSEKKLGDAESSTSDEALWKELQDLRQRLDRMEENRYASRSSSLSNGGDRTLEISKDVLEYAGRSMPAPINRRLQSLMVTCEDIYTCVRTGASPTEDQAESMMQGLINLALGLSATTGQSQEDSLLRRATSVRSPLPVPSRSLERSRTSSRLRSTGSTSFQEDDVQRTEATPASASSRSYRMFYSSPPPVSESAAARLRRSSFILRDEGVKEEEEVVVAGGNNRYGSRLEGVSSSETLQGNNNRQRRISAMMETPISRFSHYSNRERPMEQAEYQSVVRPRTSFLDRQDELDYLDSSCLRRRSFMHDESTPPPVRTDMSGARRRPHSMIFSKK